MQFEQNNIMNRLYIVAGVMLLFGLAISVKLLNLQFSEGEKYRELAEKNMVKNFVIPANRGNVYGDNDVLLATSVPKYDIRFDAMTVSEADFNENVQALANELSKVLGKPSQHYLSELKKARANKNRYAFIAKNLGYTDCMRIKSAPLFNKGPYKGGIIVEQRTKREHPIGRIAQRTVGDEDTQNPGRYSIGIEGAFDQMLRGKNGNRLKQKIGPKQWKPVYDENEVEPQDGYDIVTTINVKIQDIAHHALLEQLIHHEADHGTVVVMEVKTGAIKAISNLGRTASGRYYEKLNYAVGQSHEPGSTFKLMAWMAALEDKVIDTSTVIDTGKGEKTFYGRKIFDSKRGGHGKISAARALEVSSNIALATILTENYASNPNKFINHLKRWNLDQKTGVAIKGEGRPLIPEPGDERWSLNALPSMAYGYNLEMTPLQTLTFYNAVANNGVMVRPRFIKEVRAYNKNIITYDTEVINPKIVSEETLAKTRAVLENTVKKGTGRSLYSADFSMAGKTGTAQTEYWMADWRSNRRYVSSFAGYFPADDPKYSCIVIVYRPNVAKGIYGGDVSGPVFKRIAQKIFTESTLVDEIEGEDWSDPVILEDFNTYYSYLQKTPKTIPNVRGMAGMDAISLLENIGLKVKVQGNGRVNSQSIPSGAILKTGEQIILKLS